MKTSYPCDELYTKGIFNRYIADACTTGVDSCFKKCNTVFSKFTKRVYENIFPIKAG